MSLRQLLLGSALVLVPASGFAFQSGPPCATGWDPNFSPTSYPSVPDEAVRTSAIFDDGTGPKLYIGGDFTRIGNTLARGIARWDGESWSALGAAWSPNGPPPGSGFTGIVSALAVYDDGSGPALYVGGHFSTGPLLFPTVGLARWDGLNWTIPGGGVSGDVRALVVHDDGTGAKLYVAGITAAGGQPVGRIASWNGTTWSGLGIGIPGGTINCLASYGDGGPRKLYAGGKFGTAGGVTVNHVACWDGAAWSSLGSGVTGMPSDGRVLSMHVFNDGLESKLAVGGYFFQVNGIAASNIAAWNGTTWSTLGAGVTGDVRDITVWDDGNGGSALYAGGFLSAGGTFGLVRYVGGVWAGVGVGVGGAAVETLRVHDDGSGARLFVGGEFTSVGGGVLSTHFAAWNNASWSLLGQQRPAYGTFGPVLAFATHDDGTGPALYAAGTFAATPSQANLVARWNGNGWNNLGTGLNGYCEALLSYDLGSGRKLFASGAFTQAGGQGAACFASWDGTSWAPVPGLSGGVLHIRALQGFDDGTGPAVYAAGNFQTSIVPQMFNIGRWDGTSWSALGSGISGPGGGEQVHALAVFDDGSGPALYAGGRFTVAGGVSVSNIARWNGSSWSALGSGIGTYAVYSLCVFDDGTGPALYAGGDFNQAGGVSVTGLARWNGTSWSAVPGTLLFSPIVYSLRVVDDGSGPALSVGGRFATAGGVPAASIARWNGMTWSNLGFGVGGGKYFSVVDIGDPVSPVVYAQEFFDDGVEGGGDLYVGGAFISAGGFISTGIARYNTCAEAFTSFCAGDGLSASTCPCANYGAAGHGCATSTNANGALLVASGAPSLGADSVVLNASELPPAFATIVQGTLQAGGGLGVSFGDGLFCVSGTLTRVATRFAPGGNLQYPGVGDAPLSIGGGVPVLGGARAYQVWYRDSSLSFCTPATFNLSNGVRCSWTP